MRRAQRGTVEAEIQLISEITYILTAYVYDILGSKWNESDQFQFNLFMHYHADPENAYDFATQTYTYALVNPPIGSSSNGVLRCEPYSDFHSKRLIYQKVARDWILGDEYSTYEIERAITGGAAPEGTRQLSEVMLYIANVVVTEDEKIIIDWVDTKMKQEERIDDLQNEG